MALRPVTDALNIKLDMILSAGTVKGGHDVCSVCGTQHHMRLQTSHRGRLGVVCHGRQAAQFVSAITRMRSEMAPHSAMGLPTVSASAGSARRASATVEQVPFTVCGLLNTPCGPPRPCMQKCKKWTHMRLQHPHHHVTHRTLKYYTNRAVYSTHTLHQCTACRCHCVAAIEIATTKVLCNRALPRDRHPHPSLVSDDVFCGSADQRRDESGTEKWFMRNTATNLQGRCCGARIHTDVCSLTNF